MKLKNKKTGEIKDVVVYKAKKQPLTEGIDYQGQFKSLAELNEEWEDYEEPKVYYYISDFGAIRECKIGRFPEDEEDRKLIGNYFTTKEEAERALEKLKAIKRLKDKGFEFNYVGEYENLCGNGFEIPITAIMPPEQYNKKAVAEDLAMLFVGGGK